MGQFCSPKGDIGSILFHKENFLVPRYFSIECVLLLLLQCHSSFCALSSFKKNTFLYKLLDFLDIKQKCLKMLIISDL